VHLCFATHALKNRAKLEVAFRILRKNSMAIAADVYRTVKQDEIRAEHQRYGPLGGQSEVLTTSTGER